MESQAQSRSSTNHCRDLPAISVGKADCSVDSKDSVTLPALQDPNFEISLERSSTLHAPFEATPTGTAAEHARDIFRGARVWFHLDRFRENCPAARGDSLSRPLSFYIYIYIRRMYNARRHCLKPPVAPPEIINPQVRGVPRAHYLR